MSVDDEDDGKASLGDDPGPPTVAPPARLSAEDHLALARAPRLASASRIPLRGAQAPDRTPQPAAGNLDPTYPMISPLEGRYRLNTRKGPPIGQGDGGFGWVRQHDDGSPKMHQGIDITTPAGTTVMSVEPGVVMQAGDNDPRGYGNEVRVRHPDGRTSLYGHLSEIHVKVGDKVDQGQTIGRTGVSGNPPRGGDPHLHFGVIEGGKFVDPRPLYDHGQMHPQTSPRIYNRIHGDG
jgi:murein DD-endopeptidase MepM/ murein hydrolase activator NlpD